MYKDELVENVYNYAKDKEKKFRRPRVTKADLRKYPAKELHKASCSICQHGICPNLLKKLWAEKEKK
jgi:hypothetical protein